MRAAGQKSVKAKGKILKALIKIFVAAILFTLSYVLS